MKLDKILKKANISLTLIIIIGLLAVINFFSSNLFYRWDLTKNKDYSISSVSKNTARQLPDVVNIKAYFSDSLPSQYINLKQEVADVLDEYVNYSGGKVKVEFIDPKDDKSMQQQLYTAGIPQLQFNVLEKDKYQVVNGYLGMLIKYGDKQEAIPVIQDTQNLEYQITTALKKVTSDKLAVIGFYQGNGCADITKDVSAAYQKLKELYDVQPVNLSQDKKIPDNISTLIIAGPTEKFTDGELKAFDSYLMRGGALLVMAEGVKVGDNLTAASFDTGLNKLLEANGLKINNDLVLDVSSGMASFSQGFIQFTTNYPFWPKITGKGFDQNNAAVAKLESLVLPWVSSLDVNQNKMKNQTLSYLAKTTNRAWRETSGFNLSPQADFLAGSDKGQFNLAVSVFGRLNSAYGQSGAANSRLAVIGNSNFFRDNFLRNNPDNLLFFQNVVDNLTLDQSLVSIRSKGVSERPIKELADSNKAIARYGNIFGMTIIVVLFGFIRYFLRRRNKAVVQL